MNANELAQYLEVAFYPDEDIAKASTMLRKQASEIEELKVELQKYKPQIWEVMKEAQEK
jgi:hypothetical protein